MNKPHPSAASTITKTLLPGAFTIWVLAFVYAVFMALLLQKLILPLMPNLHASHGLLNNDAIFFHEMATSMAARIRDIGWSEWRLFPADGVTGNVGLLSALYALIGPDPVWFIPFNAAYHALGVLLLFLIGTVISPGPVGRLGGLAAAFLFLVFPSSLSWYGQNHKDAFMIAGSLIALFSFLRVLDQCERRRLLIYALLMIAGLAQVWTMRPYMLMVSAAAFSCAWLGVLACAAYSRSAEDRSATARAALMVAIAIAAAAFLPSGHSAISNIGKVQLGQFRWERSEMLPSAVDHVMQTVSALRAHTISSGQSIGAGSLVDADIVPRNASDMMAYLPRALEVGLFSPFPETWLERTTLPRVIGAMETLLWYLLAPGAVFLVLRKPNKNILACLIFTAVVLTVLAYVSPNVGTLHRIRYGFLFLFILAGAIGWVEMLVRVFRLSLVARHGGSPSEDAESASGAMLPRKRDALSASLKVFLITAVGYMGLLARDLLLTNTYGFGVELDSLYSALLLPMFFVSIFSLPLGDALVAGIQRFSVKPGDQLPSVRAAISFSLLLSAAICVTLFEGADYIFDSILIIDKSANAARLLRLALPLLLFSGLAIVGNSVLNILNQATTVAVAQLLVPVFAIAAILFADVSNALYAAVVGMILGQLANIAIVFFISYQHGYVLRPGAITGKSSIKAISGNYFFLVVAALVMNLANPVNYWFAGKLMIGSVSTWAMGSKLVLLVTGLTAAIMASVITPYFAKLVSSGENHRLRSDIFLMLVAGTWISILAALIVFAFAEPLVFVVFSGGAVDSEQALRVAYILKLGALQMPFVFSTLLLIKLAAVSSASSKIVVVAAAGLAINVLLNTVLISEHGVVGMAAAWAVSVGVSAVLLLLLTRAQTGLGYAQVLAIAGCWVVLGGLSLALHFHSIAAAFISLLLVLIALWGQWGVHRWHH